MSDWGVTTWLSVLGGMTGFIAFLLSLSTHISSRRRTSDTRVHIAHGPINPDIELVGDEEWGPIGRRVEVAEWIEISAHGGDLYFVEFEAGDMSCSIVDQPNESPLHLKDGEKVKIRVYSADYQNAWVKMISTTHLDLRRKRHDWFPASFQKRADGGLSNIVREYYRQWNHQGVWRWFASNICAMRVRPGGVPSMRIGWFRTWREQRQRRKELLPRYAPDPKAQAL